MMPERSIRGLRHKGRGFDRIWARVEAAGERAETERQEEWSASDATFAALMAMPATEREDLVAADPCYWNLATVDRLLEAADQADGEEAELLAKLATEIAGTLDAKRYGRLSLSLRTIVARCAWAEARRRQGDRTAAERAFVEAARWLDEQPPGAWERAVFCRRLAALRRDQGRADEALGLLGRAAHLFAYWEKSGSVAEVLCEAADLCLESEDPEAALDLLQGGDNLDLTRWPSFAIRIRLGKALCHAELCEPRKAVQAVQRAQALYGSVTNPVESLRYLLMEARIADETGQELRAIALLRPLVRQFLGVEAYLEAALAAVNLAKLYLLLEKAEEVRWLLTEVLPFAESDRLPLRAGAVLRFALWFALHGREDSYELLSEASDYLRLARQSPHLPWSWGPPGWTEVSWEDAGAVLRQQFCEEAGLSPAVAAREAAEISRSDRLLISWMHQALYRVPVVFGPERED